MGGACSTHGIDEKCVNILLLGDMKEIDPFGGTRSRWENNIAVDLREVGWEGVD
jgi:hypothetical protein